MKFIAPILLLLFAGTFTMERQALQPFQQKAIPSLAHACCKVIAAEWAQLEKLEATDLENIKTFNNLQPKNRAFLAQELINRCSDPLLCTMPAQGAFSPDGSTLLIAHKGLHIYDAQKGTLLRTVTHESINRYQWSNTGTYIVSIVYGEHTFRGLNYYGSVWKSDTAALLHTILHTPGVKIKFTAKDSFIIRKGMDEPWTILNIQTGKLCKRCGETNLSNHIPDQDPQEEWAITHNNNKSIFHDTHTWLPIQSPDGHLKCFSTDGSRMALEHENETTIYNRKFEPLQAFSVHYNSFYAAIDTLNNRFLSYGFNKERLFNLSDGLLIAEYRHNSSKTSRIFTSKNLSKTIEITHDESTTSDGSTTKKSTIAIVSQGAILHQYHCDEKLGDIYYTFDSNHIILTAHNRNYIMNIETGRLISCNNWVMYKPFKRRIWPHVSCDGKYLTYAGQSSFEVRQLISERMDAQKTPLEDIIEILIKK